MIGKDSSWGTAEKVSAAGSPSTGTTRAYGLDCSGFVTWAVINGYDSTNMQNSVGDGTSDQWEKANVVSEQDAQPGDLVFQNGPESGSDNHVGIICGKTDAGDWIAVHCSSSKNGVTVGEAYGASFRYIRQPSFYPTEEELAQMVSDGETADNAQAQEVSTDTLETSDGDFISDTALLTGTAGTKEDTKEDTTGVDISFEDDINIGQDDTEDMLSDGTTVESATVEMTDSLKQILKKGTTVSSKNDAVIYPQQPDNSDIQIEFED